jgi:hypothetical protein
MARTKSKTPGKNEGTVAITINLHPETAKEVTKMAADISMLRKPFIEELLEAATKDPSYILFLLEDKQTEL